MARIKKYHWPNIVSVSRPIIGVALIVWSTWLYVAQGHVESWWLAAAWFANGIGDRLDGWLSNPKRCGSTKNGKTVDELCDKLTVIPVLFALAFYGKVGFYLVALMLARDIYVTLVRDKDRRDGISATSSARWSGKIKTISQFVLIVSCFAPIQLAHWQSVLEAMALIVTVFSIVSAVEIKGASMNARDSSWLDKLAPKFGVPNYLSAIRIAVAFVVPYMFLFSPFGTHSILVAGLVAGLALATDLFDGMIARKFHQETKLGNTLDPAGDKGIQYIYGLTVIVALCLIYDLELWMIAVLAMSLAFYLVRDAVLYLLYRGKTKDVSAKLIDKVRSAGFAIWLVLVWMALVLPSSAVTAEPGLLWFAFGFVQWLLSPITSLTALFVELLIIAALSVASMLWGVHRYKRDVVAKLLSK